LCAAHCGSDHLKHIDVHLRCLVIIGSTFVASFGVNIFNATRRRLAAARRRRENERIFACHQAIGIVYHLDVICALHLARLARCATRCFSCRCVLRSPQ
jgi:hypothetical protein